MTYEICLHVYKRRRKYNPQRGAQSTFVHWVADRYAQVILQRYRAQKRLAVTVSLDDVTPESLGAVPDSYTAHAIAVVEAVISVSSDNLREFLDRLLHDGSTRPPSDTVACELRMIARQMGASWRDFAIVRRVLDDDQYV